MRAVRTVFLCWVCAMCTAGVACASKSDELFESIAVDCIEDLLRLDPEWATSVGDHRYDSFLTDRSREGIAARVTVYNSYLQRLDSIEPDALASQNRIDFYILVANLERMVFEADVLRPHENNPEYYNVGDAIYSLLVRDFAPLEGRLRKVRDRLLEIPDVIAAARENLDNPASIHTETAIRQNRGVLSLVRDDLNLFMMPADTFRDEVRPIVFTAVEALEDYGRWLEEDLLPRSNGDFRLGDELWREKLRKTLDSDLSKEEILERAEEELVTTQTLMYETALPLYRRFFAGEKELRRQKDMKHVNKSVLDKLAEDRPDNDTIVPRVKEALAAATLFVRERNLVTVPDEPVDVITMPEFRRGVAVAYCEAPGPLERELFTFFAVSPTPGDWPPERTASFFREYNDYMLQNVTVHEAMPGHYLQLTHSNRFEAPTKVRALFSSGPFVEGWAVYSERIMADAGYGGPKVRMQQLKMRLRVIINAILDQKIHTGEMTEAEAMALMMNEGFQEEGEAAGKWRRACLTSTQLSTYFVGTQEIEDIRRACEDRITGVMDLKRFHDRMLSFGSPPTKYVRQLMEVDK